MVFGEPDVQIKKDKDGKIAVKVINPYGDGVLKVYEAKRVG